MNEAHVMMLSLTMYKIVTIFAGLAFAFMGYRLFISGIFAEAGELRTNWDNRSLVLRKAAPGTFFAMLGAVITCVSLWRGLSFEDDPQEAAGGGSGTISHVKRRRELHPRTGSVGGTGMFSQAPSTASSDSARHSDADKSRATVVEDIAYLNSLSNELEAQSGDSARLTTPVEDRKRILDIIERAKVALMLSVWSRDWGDHEEFKKWASYADGYDYSEPPSAIAPAAAIYKRANR